MDNEIFNNKLLTDEILAIFATIWYETKTLGILGIHTDLLRFAPNFRH